MRQQMINNVKSLFIVTIIFVLGIAIGVALQPKPTPPEPTIIEVEKIVEEVVYIEVESEPEYAYHFSASERLLLAQLVYREGRGESFETQCGIVSVVLNRLAYGYWGNTIEKVIYAKGQFTVAGSLKKTTPRTENFAVVDFIEKYGTTLPAYVMYFNAGGYAREPYMRVLGDNTYFSYIQRDYNKLTNH